MKRTFFFSWTSYIWKEPWYN